MSQFASKSSITLYYHNYYSLAYYYSLSRYKNYEVGCYEVGKLRSGGSLTKWALAKWEDYEVEKITNLAKITK